MCMHMADLLCCATETKSIVNQLYSNKDLLKKRLNKLEFNPPPKKKTVGWIDFGKFNNAVNFYTDMKISEILQNEMTWINLTNIVLKERRQTEKI